MSQIHPSGSGRLFNRKYVSLLTVSFLISFLNAPRYALLPVYVETNLLRTPLFSGGLRALFLILGGIFAVLAGRLADDLGVKRIYIVGTLGPLLAALIFKSGDPLLLIVLCIGIGITSGFDSAGGQSYLIQAISPSVIGIASAGYFLGNTLGTAAGNLLAGPITDALGYDTLGTVTALGSIMLIIIATLLLPALPSGVEDPGSHSLSGSFQLIRRSEVRLLLGIRYLPTCYWGAVTLLVPLLIFRISGTNTSATTYSAVSLIIAAAFQLLTGKLCDRIGRWKPIFVSSSIVTFSALGLAITGHTLVGLYTFGIIASASAWSLSTTMPGLLQLIAQKGEKGRIVGLAHLAWSLGMLSGNLGGGKLIEWGPSLPFGIAVLFCLGTVTCGWGLYRIYSPEIRTPLDTPK